MEINIIFWDMFLKLFLAMLLGIIIGAERVLHGKTAGMRTYAMVAMGSALFVIISQSVAEKFLILGSTSFDPLRMASQIIVGIGFLGAGMIIFHDSKLTGLTTAGGLWVAAGIGMAAGFGLYSIALTATFLTLFIFTTLWVIEEKFKKISNRENQIENSEKKG